MRPYIFGVLLVFFISCDKNEFTAILQEGPAPSNVRANIVFNNEEAPFSVTISPTADGATAFEVLSGIPGEPAQLIGIQQSVTFLYPEAEENFFATVRAIAPNDLVTEERFEVVPPADPCTQIFSAPVTWDADGPSAFEFGFNGAEVSVVPNPDPSGANASESNVLQITQDGGGNFDGFGVQMTSPALFTAADKIVRLTFWSDREIPLRLTVQQDPNNTTEREAEVNLIHTGSGWEELRFDFSTATAGFTGSADGALGIPDFVPFVPTGDYIRFQMFISPGDDVSGTFYLDNVGVCPDGGAAPPPIGEEEEPEPCTLIFEEPVTLENGESFFGFNGVDVQVVTNPDPSGANTEANNVLEIVQDGGANFDGFGTVLNVPTNFAADDKVVRVLFWSQSEVTVRLNMQQNPANNDTEREAEVAASHGGTGWEELQFDFANAVAGFTGNPDGALGIADGAAFAPTGQYNQPTFFIAPGEDVSGTFYLDNLGVCPDGGTPPPPPADEDSCASIFSEPVTLDNGEEFFGFNGVTTQIVTNPDPSGANPDTNNVVEIVQDGGGNFDGFGTVLGVPADFSGDDKEVRLLFWSETAVTVRMNMQQNPTNNETEREVEVAAAHGGSGWEELRFDFANGLAGFTGNPDGALGIADGASFAPMGQYNQPTFFIAPGEDVSGTFYLDNLGSCPD